MKDKRQFVRHPIEVKVEIHQTGSSSFRSARTQDLSFGGICITHKKAYSIGQVVRVSIPVSRKVFRIKGRISYCYTESSWQAYKIGIAFLHPSSMFILKMAQEIVFIQRYQKEVQRQLGRPISENEAAEQWIRKNAREFADLFDRYQADPG